MSNYSIHVFLTVIWFLLSVYMAMQIKSGTLAIMKLFQALNISVFLSTLFCYYGSYQPTTIEVCRHALLVTSIGIIAYALYPRSKRLSCTYKTTDINRIGSAC